MPNRIIYNKYTRPLLCLLALLPTGLFAGPGVELAIVAPERVGVDDVFRVEYVADTDRGYFLPLQFAEADAIAGHMTSRSSSVTITSGETRREVRSTVIYMLRARRTGSFTLPEARLRIDTTLYSWPSRTIEVVEGPTPKNPTPSGERNTPQKDDRRAAPSRGRSTSPQTPGQGEAPWENDGAPPLDRRERAGLISL
ncbi:hypothetical protein FACS1894159_06250 [Bacteroidia bacterium]|nr:hypothetical protein FACS1894159_06250 [Bacteroidia bacterium]